MSETAAKTTLPVDQWPGRFDEEQYDLLTQCSDESSFKKWNAYRRKNRRKPILLEGADLANANLRSANLRRAKLSDANLSSADLSRALLVAAECRNARFDGVVIDGADFSSAKLNGARLTSVTANETKFRFADCSDSAFHEARLYKVNFDRANLSNATFQSALVMGCNLNHTDLRSAKFVDARLQATRLSASVVDGGSLFWNCQVDWETDATGVGLSSARIEPQLQTRLEANVRRIWWRKWCAEKHADAIRRFRGCLKQPLRCITAPLFYLYTVAGNALVRGFWWSTAYGTSTQRLLTICLLICAVFAALYYSFPWLTNDAVLQSSAQPVDRAVRALYFSVVTITTVGFGDVAANPRSLLGHVVVTLHVISGYTILTSLIVRMGILFISMPAVECRSGERELLAEKNTGAKTGGSTAGTET